MSPRCGAAPSPCRHRHSRQRTTRHPPQPLPSTQEATQPSFANRVALIAAENDSQRFRRSQEFSKLRWPAAVQQRRRGAGARSRHPRRPRAHRHHPRQLRPPHPRSLTGRRDHIPAGPPRVPTVGAGALLAACGGKTAATAWSNPGHTTAGSTVDRPTVLLAHFSRPVRTTTTATGDPAGEPDLERAWTHDHVDLRRERRLHRQDRPPPSPRTR